MFSLKKILLHSVMLSSAFAASAQDSWPSPEVAQMRNQAQANIARGNYKDAITTFRQAIVLAPDKFVLYEGLGKALYLSGSYVEAVQTLRPFIDKPEASEEFYALLDASYISQEDIKRAREVLKKGLDHFPASGPLYHDLGDLYDREKKPEEALGAWVEGIHKDPAYALNYYDAARKYLDGGDMMPGLLYGEIYLNIAQDGSRADTLKKMLFTGYKNMFDNIAAANNRPSNTTGSFIYAVKQIYLNLTPVVSDGITTENLTMVRTRFLMDWFAKYADKYPYSLFVYQDYLVKNGLFDIYNEWLFGKAESIVEYNAWNQFHPGEMDIFLKKNREHALFPVTADVYNDHGMDSMIRKKKR